MPIITPKGDSSSPAQPAQTAQSARERAIARLSTQPVPNPSQVSVEELGAVKAPAQAFADAVVGQSNTGETPTEAPKEATSPAKTEEQPLSTQYAVLARKEKALRAKVQAQEASAKAKEEAVAAREAALAAKEAEYQSNYIAKDRLTQDPITVLNELGLSYDQITQLILNQPKSDPAVNALRTQMEQEMKAIREQQEQNKKFHEEQQTRAYQQAVNQIRLEASQLVSSDPNFEMIKESNSVDDVVDLIEKTYKNEGMLLSVEEAAKAVEEYLVEEAIKLAKLTKIQQKINPPKEASAPSMGNKQPDAKQQPQTLKTLTNTVGVSRQMTARERAILAFKNELK